MPRLLSRIHRMCRRPLAAGLLAAAAMLTVALPALADEFVDRANAAIRKVGDDRRSDKVLLPLLPTLARPPAILKDQRQAALFGNKGPGWAECVAWAQAETQKKLLDTLKTITRDDNDPQKSFGFGLPYGIDATDPDLVASEMYVDLGDQGTLAAAKFLYLDELEHLGVLVHVEASRRLEAGDGGGALEIMKEWLFFCRQMADRPFLKEKLFGMQSMLLALQRISDIAYTDFRSQKHVFAPSTLVNMVGLLRDRSLYIDRIRLPEADFIAREQLISKVITNKGGPNPATFATTMARIAAVDHPLRLFSSAAYWEKARAGHAGWYDCQTAISGLKSDWETRWKLPPFDVLHSRRTYYRDKIAGRPRLAVVAMGMDQIEDLFPLRREIDVEQSGARMGLACYAYFLREKTLPPVLASVRGPNFTRVIDTDPYSSTNRELQYFRPVTDTPKDRNGNDLPFSLRLWLPDPLPQFEVPLDKTHFVLYSIGPDDKSQKAADCTQGRPIEGDYLLWPPALSLLRQKMIDTGELK